MKKGIVMTREQYYRACREVVIVGLAGAIGGWGSAGIAFVSLWLLNIVFAK
jgi:hypothetical protein